MKLFNVAVVGLSGTEKDKGQAGAGKSCLCNRFVRPLSDGYEIDHISVLSQVSYAKKILRNPTPQEGSPKVTPPDFLVFLFT